MSEFTTHAHEANQGRARWPRRRVALLAGVLALSVACAAPVLADPAAGPAAPASGSVVSGDTRAASLHRAPGPAPDGSLREARKRAMRAYVKRDPFVKDREGVAASAYHGRYFTVEADAARRCILQRESNGLYRAVSASGTYRGGYQLSPELAVGVTWMMLKEHKRLMGPRKAKRVLERLRGKSVNKWNRYWQDAAFFTVYNFHGPQSGKQHWFLSGSYC